MYDRNEEDHVMPFSDLSNFELIMENEPVRTVILDRLDNNGFHTFLRDYRRETGMETDSHETGNQYYDIKEFNTLTFKNHPTTSMMHINIRRIAKNKGKLLGLLSTLKEEFDIIILTEIGNDAEHYINKNFLPHYDAFIDTPKHNRYGGTAVLIKQGYGSATTREELKMTKSCTCENCAYENTWIEIKTTNNEFIIGALYRHPNGNVEHFVHDMDKVLSQVPKRLSCFLVGDMNIDLLKFKNNLTFEYFTTLSAQNFMPFISAPTRITDRTSTLIDHIFVKLSDNDRHASVLAGNILTDISDHLPNFLLLNDAPRSNQKNRPFVRIFSEKNITKFKESLSEIDWTELLRGQNATEMCNILYYHVNNLFSSTFPIIRLSRKRAKDKKWITSALRQCILKKNTLYRKQLQKPTETNIKRYKNYRNVLNTCLKEAENIYYTNIFTERTNGITNFWKAFGETLNSKKKKQRHRLSKLIHDGNTLTDDKDIANGLNDYFCNIGKQISSEIKTKPGEFHKYLKNKINQTFFLAPVMEEEVYRELASQNPKKSPGPDKITPKLIKQCAMQLTKPLSIIFNKSIENATYPNPWKVARVLALYKKKSIYLPENYRPISLLNCFGKVFEKLIYKQMISFIEKHKIIYIYQYGFRKKHSTTLALIDIIDRIRFYADQNEYVLGIFLDITKAFDSVNHDILFHKLEHYGFRGHALGFLRSYLSDRKQYTSIQDTPSETLSISYGVPQGSILGPLLFLLYINDLQNSITNSDLRLFADDTAVFLHGDDPETVTADANNEMKNIVQWYNANKLKLSLNKSNFIQKTPEKTFVK